MGFQVLRCWVLGFWIYGSTIRFFCLIFNLNEFEIRVSSIKVLDFLTCSVCFHNYVFKVSNLWLLMLNFTILRVLSFNVSSTEVLGFQVLKFQIVGVKVEGLGLCWKCWYLYKFWLKVLTWRFQQNLNLTHPYFTTCRVPKENPKRPYSSFSNPRNYKFKPRWNPNLQNDNTNLTFITWTKIWRF